MLDPLGKGVYGATGAALWIIAVYGLEIGLTASRGNLQWKASIQTVAGVVGLVLMYLILGGAAPFVADANNAKEAVAVGLGWQGVFGQFVKK